MSINLGNLSEPTQYHQPIVIDGCEKQALVNYLKSMLLIRKTEQQLHWYVKMD